MKRFVFLACVFGACGGESQTSAKQAPTPATGPTPAEPATPEPAKPEPASDAGAASPTASDCVAECVATRQMQATGPEQIQADCEARCLATPKVL